MIKETKYKQLIQQRTSKDIKYDKENKYDKDNKCD